MKKSICIPVEQYDKMLESYDQAMKEIRDLRRQLRAIRYARPEKRVAPVQHEDSDENDVVKKSEDMLGKIDDRYDMTIPEIRDIVEHYTDIVGAICCAFRYGYLQGTKAAEQPRNVQMIVDILKEMDQESQKEVYYFVQGYAGR